MRPEHAERPKVALQLLPERASIAYVGEFVRKYERKPTARVQKSHRMKDKRHPEAARRIHRLIHDRAGCSKCKFPLVLGQMPHPNIWRITNDGVDFERWQGEEVREVGTIAGDKPRRQR